MTLRKHTKFQVCERHARWFDGQDRARTIECFVEGGPGGWTPGCKRGRCRLWPGTDFFEPSVCSSEMELEWTHEPLCEDCGNARGVSDPERFACPTCWAAVC
jgi:hypothetical protein